MTIQEVLEEALQLEKDGRDFYLKGLEIVKGNLGKEVLKRLADEELEHMDRIREGYDRIKKGEEFSTKSPEGIKKSSREYFENIFTEAKKQIGDLISHGDQEIDVLKTAMDLESKSHQFYVEQSKTMEDKKVKDFLDFLASEEYRHYNLLYNTLEYVSNPTEWYYQEEKPIFEGG